MTLPRISLQALDAFERVARSGSVQAAAGEMKLSISSVSHHIARLEEQLGLALFDRSTRPFLLTQAGHQTLQHLAKGLHHIRCATNEGAVSGLSNTRALRVGIVEEFENTVTPELAMFLTRQMPQAALTLSNILSHEAAGLLRKGEIDLALVATADGPQDGLTSLPLLNDPFVFVVPKSLGIAPSGLLDGKSNLPFLRFNQNHLIGKQISGHLKRNRLDIPSRFAFDSIQPIMAIVAGGGGWSIITALGFARAQRWAKDLRLEPLSLPAFSRKIALISRDSADEATRQALANMLRHAMQQHILQQVCKSYPWLTASLTIEH